MRCCWLRRVSVHQFSQLERTRADELAFSRRRLVWFKQWSSSKIKIDKDGKEEAKTKTSTPHKSHGAASVSPPPPGKSKPAPQGSSTRKKPSGYDRAPYVAVHLRRAHPGSELLGCEFGVPSVECGKEGRQWTVSTEQVAKAVRMAVERVNATGVYVATQTYPTVHPKCVRAPGAHNFPQLHPFGMHGAMSSLVRVSA